jgi:hypothetical protein
MMSAQLNHIGAQISRLDACVRCKERAAPLGARPAPPAANGPQAFRVAEAARTMRLLDLPAELLVLVAAQLAPDDELAATLVAESCARRSQAPSDARQGRGCRPGLARYSFR